MILETLVRQKRYFDAKNKKDIQSAKLFFTNHSWGHETGCPFILEYPYMSVPDMIKDKLIHKVLDIEYNREHHWGFK